MRIVLVAESGADIPEKTAKKYDIHIVPMYVVFDGCEKADGAFPVEDIVDYYKETGKVPGTGAPNIYDFSRIFDDIHEKYLDAGILFLAYSAATTSSFSNAGIAIAERDYVRAVDTKQASAGQGAVVVKTAHMLEKHPEWSLEQAAEYVERIRDSVKMCFFPVNLDFLRAGGRLSNAAAFCGTLLRIVPRVDLCNGVLVAVRRYRGSLEKMVSKILKEFVKEKELKKDEIWFIVTVGTSEKIKKLAVYTAKELGFENIHMINAGGVITVHGGPGAFGIVGCQS